MGLLQSPRLCTVLGADKAQEVMLTFAYDYSNEVIVNNYVMNGFFAPVSLYTLDLKSVPGYNSNLPVFRSLSFSIGFESSQSNQVDGPQAFFNPATGQLVKIAAPLQTVTDSAATTTVVSGEIPFIIPADSKLVFARYARANSSQSPVVFNADGYLSVTLHSRVPAPFINQGFANTY